jgi:DNA-binding MarR family transcriptional regulator
MALISRHSGLTPIASEAFVALLRVAGQLQRDLDDACHEFGLTHDQYNVLRILRGVHPEGHPRFEIAARLVRRAPDVTRLIDRLERRGWVRRGWSPGNRRLSIATITDEGLALLRQVAPQIDAVARSYVAGLSPSDSRVLRRCCLKMLR